MSTFTTFHHKVSELLEGSKLSLETLFETMSQTVSVADCITVIKSLASVHTDKDNVKAFSLYKEVELALGRLNRDVKEALEDLRSDICFEMNLANRQASICR